MTKQIRNLGVFLAFCYTALFLQVNRLTVFEAEALQDKPTNNREIVRDFSSPRGTISTADGVVIAQSVPSNDEFVYQRQFPEGPRYAHITGYYGFSVGSSGLEDTYNEELAGRTGDFDLQDLQELFVERERVGNLHLSVRDDVQRVAQEELGERPGSVVAVDPRTGAVLGMWSFPSYDPNLLATHDLGAAATADATLNEALGNPKRSRAYQDRFFPGSTFKVVTGTAGVERGGVTEDSPDYPSANGYTPPGSGRPLRNFGGNTCGGTLFFILASSCNSAFAQMGVEDVGGEGLLETAKAFGFNADAPLEQLPDGARSVFPRDVDGTPLEQNPGVVAQLAIGQNDVQATPLQMALVAAAVANEGEAMRPYVVQEVRDEEDEVIREADPEVWQTAMSPAAAGLMQQAMRTVVEEGSAQLLDDGIEDYDVGGKTGTAQLGTDPPRSHAWVIGWAGPEGETPHVAVAVLVEGQEGASEQTGGMVAAPIGAAVMQQVLEGGQ